MTNGYDAHSLTSMGLKEATSSSSMVAVRDARFTRSGIGWRSETTAEAATPMATTIEPDLAAQVPPPIMYPAFAYPGGVAARVRGHVNEAALSWENAQEATRPQTKPRKTLPPWLRGDEDEEDEETEESARV